MNSGRLLAIDDEQNIRRLLRNELGLEGYEVVTAKTGEEGLKLLNKGKYDLVLLDIKLPKMSGLELLRLVRKRTAPPPVIMITGYGDIQTAVESMKLGARDYITKPFKLSELLAVIKQVMAESARRGHAPEHTAGTVADETAAQVQCPSRAMQELYSLAEKVALTDVTVLVQGETGVGKDVMARYIYSRGARKDRPFVVVDCGLLNENLAESELYGHTKGAFSGAKEQKKGLVEESHTGTIFFDEIGNIELEMQKKFLRFLETKRFRRLGETKEREVDSRIILATNLDLKDAARKGTLRSDLLYRMDVVCIAVPSLRERPEDIGPLAKHFLDMQSFDGRPRTISPEAAGILRDYPWPGNVRELRSVMIKAAVFARSHSIEPDDLPSHVLGGRKQPLPSCPRSLEDLEREHIMKVLEDTGGNQSKAAEILGINRKTLYKKIHKHQLFA